MEVVIGEGHMSSIIFRRGTVDGAGNITMEPSDPYHQHPRRLESRWSGAPRLLPRVTRTGVPETFTETVLGPTGDAITTEQLRRYLYRVQKLEGMAWEDARDRISGPWRRKPSHGSEVWEG